MTLSARRGKSDWPITTSSRGAGRGGKKETEANVQTATATAKTALEQAQEKYAAAKKNYDSAEEEVNGPVRRLAKARTELWAADAALKTIERGGRI